MKAYEKIEQMESLKEHYAVMLIDRIKEKGSLACQDIGFKSMCDELKTLIFGINTLKEIDEADDDEYFFNVDQIFDGLANTSTGGETIYSIQRRLMTKVENLKQKFNATKIITNGNLAAVLQDMDGYSITTNPKINKEDAKIPFPMGQIGNLKIFVDAFQRWDDNRIVFFQEDDTVGEGGLGKLMATLKLKDTNGVLI
jgi:uncharacterized protein YerC